MQSMGYYADAPSPLPCFSSRLRVHWEAVYEQGGVEGRQSGLRNLQRKRRRRYLQMFWTLERTEIRGFGSFSLHHRSARLGRNPKTGEAVSLTEKHVPHFKPGKELRDMVDASREKFKIVD